MTILKVEDDESPLCPVMESDLVFQLVYLLMVEVDECLSSGVHLRDTEGRLLCYFDQVVLAMGRGDDNGLGQDQICIPPLQRRNEVTIP